MENELVLKNNLKEARAKKQISQRELAEMVGVSRNTISSIETGQPALFVTVINRSPGDGSATSMTAYNPGMRL